MGPAINSRAGSSMSDRSKDISEFKKITGVADDKAAEFWLDASQDLNSAIANYMDQKSESRIAENLNDPTNQVKKDPFSSVAKADPKNSTQKKRIRTFNDLKNDGDDEEKFVASENQMIVNRDKKQDSNDFISSIKNLVDKQNNENTNSNNPNDQEVTLVLYKDGFHLLYEREPRLLSKPGNQEILDTLKTGTVPTIIQSRYPGKSIIMKVEQKNEEKCPKMPQGFKLF